MWSSATKLPLLLVALFLLWAKICLAIDCFKCSSFGGSSQWCEDPFHHNFSSTILRSPCLAGRKGRDGIYPATACIKLNGRFEDTGEIMVVRDCALDSGSLTADTEIIRSSHCGSFYFGNRYVRGCVQSCSTDACNHSARHPVPWSSLTFYSCISSSLVLLMASHPHFA